MRACTVDRLFWHVTLSYDKYKSGFRDGENVSICFSSGSDDLIEVRNVGGRKFIMNLTAGCASDSFSVCALHALSRSQSLPLTHTHTHMHTVHAHSARTVWCIIYVSRHQAELWSLWDMGRWIHSELEGRYHREDINLHASATLKDCKSSTHGTHCHMHQYCI